MKATILIVEDEPLIADDIALSLQNIGYEIAGIVHKEEDVDKFLSGMEIDLVILDINLGGVRDGIDIASSLTIPFIFLTSYYDDATIERAKKVEPSAYLVKPFDEGDLKANVEIALHKNRRKEARVESKSLSEKLFVKQDSELISIRFPEIYYVEAYDNYAYVHTRDRKYLISHTLKSIQEKLETFGFVRSHRSYLINFDMITSISEGMVHLDHYQLPLGASYRNELFDRLRIL